MLKNRFEPENTIPSPVNASLPSVYPGCRIEEASGRENKNPVEIRNEAVVTKGKCMFRQEALSVFQMGENGLNSLPLTEKKNDKREKARVLWGVGGRSQNGCHEENGRLSRTDVFCRKQRSVPVCERETRERERGVDVMDRSWLTATLAHSSASFASSKLLEWEQLT